MNKTGLPLVFGRKNGMSGEKLYYSMHLYEKFRQMSRKWLTRAVIFTFSTILLSGCSEEGDSPRADISRYKADVRIKRFDRALFALDTAALESGLQQLTAEYPYMAPLFAVQIIHDQTNPSETPLEAVRGFLSAPQVRQLFDTVQQVYPDLRDLEKELNLMFRYYQFYFPEKPVPEVVAMVSEFATDAFTAGDSLCGIGLDMFLGPDYPGYNPDLFPAYLRRQFERTYIPVRLAKALVQNQVGPAPGKRLLDQMLHNGKMLYLVSGLLPDTPDSLIMGYTRAQMDGCKANEQESWARLLDQNLLYSTEFDKIRKLVTPSPNAPVLFEEAPGEIGNWIGWQIVKAYVKKHPQTTAADLLKASDAQAFLEASKYKPRRVR